MSQDHALDDAGSEGGTERMRPLTVKERILLHLFDYSRFADEYETPIEVTQEGIARAAAIHVPHVVQYVRPLKLEGFIDERMSHVRHQTRRRKVYFLSPKGRQQVAALRMSLLGEEVPFEKATGDVGPTPLAKIYHEERRGSTLLQLVQEVNSTGRVMHVVEAKVTPFADFTQEAPKVGRFYGRKGELERVLHAIGEKPIVVVTGFAGIGKTTLGAKLCDEVRGSRNLFWRRIRPWDTAGDIVSRLATFLKAQGRTTLHNLLTLTEARELSRIEELLTADLAGLRALLIFDDVHEASADVEAFLSLLARILRSQKGVTALFLSRTSLRFYSQREVVLEGSVEEVSLAGLDKKSSAALLLDAGVPSQLVNRLTAASGGNPLFLQLFASTSPQEAPETGWNTVATYIAEQIEPFLDPSERDCLETASFLDISVPASGLLLEARASMKTLVGLQRKGLLDQIGAGRYALHDTLKDFFQKSMGADRRGPLAAKIVTWLLEQGEAAAKRGDHQEAVGYLNNAAKLEPDRARWVLIMERLGELRLFMIHLVGAERAFRAALAEAKDSRDKARLHGRVAHALQYGLNLDEADREIDVGLSLLPSESFPEVVPLLVRKSDIAVYRRDFDRAEETCRRLSEIVDRLPVEEDMRGRVALSRGRIRLYRGGRFDLDEVAKDFRTASEIFEKTRNEFLLSVSLADLGTALLRAGRIEEALAQQERAAPHIRASGHRHNWVSYLAERARMFVEYRGDFDQAEALLQEKMRQTKQDGLLWLFLETYLDFANLRRRQGRFEEARESLGYFLQMTSEGELYRLAKTWWLGGRLHDLTLMVRLCARCGDAGSADAYLHQASELAQERPPEMSGFELAWSEAALHAARGEIEEAEASFRRALDRPAPFLLQRMAHEDEPRAECMLDYGRFLASRNEKRRARDILEEARAISTRRCMKTLGQEVSVALRSLES